MILAWLFLMAAADAPADCTWINTATASGILGGASTYTSLERGGAGPKVCEWTRGDGSLRSTLRVEIIMLGSRPSAYADLQARCPAPVTRLKTLGNEAVRCGNAQSQTIVGRVRDQGFVITISNGDATLTADLLAAKVRRAADQVVGNLY